MSIQDFYRKFVSVSEENALVATLRRLSLIEDPKIMLEGDQTADWYQWPAVSESMVEA
jgi:hypothetical protein